MRFSLFGLVFDLFFVRAGKIENEGEKRERKKEGKIGARANCCVLGVGCAWK